MQAKLTTKGIRMRKALIITGASAGIALVTGIGLVTSSNFNEVQVPMAGEETIIEIEYVETPQEADIVIEGLVENSEPKAEIVEEVELSECEKLKQEVLEKYGTFDFLSILRHAWNGKAGEHLDQLGVKTWEEFKERFDKEFPVRGATPLHMAEYFIKLDKAINDVCK